MGAEDHPGLSRRLSLCGGCREERAGAMQRARDERSETGVCRCAPGWTQCRGAEGL